MSMKRNLIICCDGTWNDATNDTNVLRFKDAIHRNTESAGVKQYTHYEKGVGTRKWELLSGGVYGYGLEKRILGSYRYLRKRYAQPGWKPDDIRIYLIGFSRGAYTARRLSGLIAHSGIPKKIEDVDLGWEVYVQRDETSAKKLKQEGRFLDVKTQMVGVFDTVKSTNDADYHDSKLAPNVLAGYHAMAIDEKRSLFPVLRWDRDSRALQVWFAGVHSDVGGGYKQRGLGDITLKWMMDRGRNEGLYFRKKIYEELEPNPMGQIHKSFTGIWEPLGARRRDMKQSDWIHHSVETRVKEKREYRPPNLPSTRKYWKPPTS